jgi:hypothetical protein
MEGFVMGYFLAGFAGTLGLLIILDSERSERRTC